jgi:hypothetical protein
MTIKEFAANVANAQENCAIVTKIENAFGCLLSSECKKILSVNEEGEFFDDDDIRRLMSTSEILSSSQDLHVDFPAVGIVPIIDCGDNDFAAYNFRNGKWCKYNIVENCRFSEKDTFAQLWS